MQYSPNKGGWIGQEDNPYEIARRDNHRRALTKAAGIVYGYLDSSHSTPTDIRSREIVSDNGLGQLFVRGQLDPSQPKSEPFMYEVVTSKDGAEEVKAWIYNEDATEIAYPKDVPYRDRATEDFELLRILDAMEARLASEALSSNDLAA